MIGMFRRIVDHCPHVGTISVLIVWQATHVRPEYYITLTGRPNAFVCLHKQKRVLWYRFQNYHLFKSGCKKCQTAKLLHKDTLSVLNQKKNGSVKVFFHILQLDLLKNQLYTTPNFQTILHFNTLNICKQVYFCINFCFSETRPVLFLKTFTNFDISFS